MTKREFLLELADKIDCLPQDDIQHWLDYYSEMIDDHAEDGMTEEQAVYAMGNIYDIATQILIDTPIKTIAKIKPRRERNQSTGVTVLAVLGFLVAVPFIIAAAATVLALAVSVVSLWFSLYVVVIACIVSGAFLTASGVMKGMSGNIAALLAQLGAGLFIIGFSTLILTALNYVSKKLRQLLKKLWAYIKMQFIKRRAYNGEI